MRNRIADATSTQAETLKLIIEHTNDLIDQKNEKLASLGVAPITAYRAAKLYIIEVQISLGSRYRHQIRVEGDKLIERAVNDPSNPHDSAWIKYEGSQVAVLWKNNELTIDTI